MAEYRNTRTDAVRISSTFLGYPYVEVGSEADDTEIAAQTADAILKEVGSDAELARAALAAEKQRETPRKVLTAKLEKIIEDAEAAS